MKRNIFTAILAVAAMWCAGTASAANQTKTLVDSRSKMGDPITLGKWHCNFDKAKKYATDHGYPFIAVWSNGEGCSHCIRFESACNSSTFKSWMKKSGCVFYFAYSGDSFAAAKKGSTEFNWIRGDNTSYPFIRIYWKKSGKVKVDVKTIGDVMDNYKDGSAGGKNLVSYLTDKKTGKLKDYKYTPPAIKYAGGSFDAAEGVLAAELDGAGEIATTAVEVSLTRTNSQAVAMAATNTLIVDYPSGASFTNTIAWAKGDEATNVTVAIDGVYGLAAAGDKVSVTLKDDAGKNVDKTDITLVAEPENSPKNPRWIGERTAETLGWGEWTMDIDAATNKVAAYNGSKGALKAPSGSDRAYSLLLIGGPLWCPDCINLEERLFTTGAFKTWAAERKVACVAIDEAPFARSSGTTTAPTLLSREVDPKTGKSGADYISRKMVPVTGAGTTNAAFVIERNLGYVMNDTEHGGYCTPDNTESKGNTGTWKTGVPCVIVLRDDGSVAGRLYQFSNDFRDASRTNTPAETLVRRLDEMLDQIDDPGEDLNDSRRTTRDTVGMRVEVAGRTLSFCDGADVYRLDPAESYGRRLGFTVDAEDGTALEISVITVAGGAEKVIAAASGSEFPFDIGADIDSSNAYVKVSYPTDANGYACANEYGERFSIANPGSTVFPYTLKTDFVVKPTDVRETVTVTGEKVMTVALVSNQVYRITGLDASKLPEGLVPVEGAADFYTSELEDDVALALTGYTAEIQRWNPGRVGFSVGAATVAETAGVYEMKLVRTGGVSGRATVTLSLDESTPALDELVEYDFSDPFVWEEGESETKTVPVWIVDNGYADGNQILVFDSAAGGDAEDGTTRLRLTLRDDDKKVAGKIAIQSADPAFAKKMEVFARKGGEVTVGLGRELGADGEQSVTLAASAGTLDVTSFAWANREADTRSAKLTLPSSGKSVKVTMAPAKGSAVDTARRILTVNLLDADVPGFKVSRHDVAATRYVPAEPATVEVDPTYVTDWSKVKVTKYSGALPAGMTWKYDAGAKALVVSGTPTAAGVATAAFRVSEGSKAGLTVTVSVDVLDPVVTGGGLSGLEPLNAAVKTSRTFAALPVLDPAEKRLVGALTLTIPRTGRLSAKYLTVDAAKAASFSTKSWSGMTGAGVLTARLAGTVDGAAAALDVEVSPDGTVAAVLDYPARTGLEILFPETVWSKKNRATDFKGYYTVELPVAERLAGNLLAAGSGYVTLKMNTTSALDSGKVAYAGLLPNGRAFSGSATLLARDWLDDPDFLYWKRGIVPILSVAAADTLAGVVEINPGAADPTASDYRTEGGETVATGRCYYKHIRRTVREADETEGLRWRHVEPVAEASSEALLGVWGTYYDAAENFLALAKTNYSISNGALKLFALDGINDLDGELLDSLARGAWDSRPTNAVAGVTLSFAKASKSAKASTSMLKSASTTKLSLAFTLSTGIVKGSFKLPMESGSTAFTYQGVLLPGFGTGDCTDCGVDARTGGTEAALRPFCQGAAWINDTLTYEDANGRVRTATVRRSTPFSIGVLPGE